MIHLRAHGHTSPQIYLRTIACVNRAATGAPIDRMSPKKQKAPVIFESVTHPKLESLDPADAVLFIRER